MYGINPITLASVLTTAVIPNLIFGNNGAVKLIINNVVKYAAEQNIDMVKSMLDTLARQNENIYKEVIDILKKHFTDEELKYITE